MNRFLLKLPFLLLLLQFKLAILEPPALCLLLPPQGYTNPLQSFWRARCPLLKTFRHLPQQQPKIIGSPYLRLPCRPHPPLLTNRLRMSPPHRCIAHQALPIIHQTQRNPPRRRIAHQALQIIRQIQRNPIVPPPPPSEYHHLIWMVPTATVCLQEPSKDLLMLPASLNIVPQCLNRRALPDTCRGCLVPKGLLVFPVHQ